MALRSRAGAESASAGRRCTRCRSVADAATARRRKARTPRPIADHNTSDDHRPRLAPRPMPPRRWRSPDRRGADVGRPGRVVAPAHDALGARGRWLDRCRTGIHRRRTRPPHRDLGLQPGGAGRRRERLHGNHSRIAPTGRDRITPPDRGVRPPCRAAGVGHALRGLRAGHQRRRGRASSVALGQSLGTRRNRRSLRGSA